MKAIATIALNEARQMLRSRWMLAYSALIALLGVAISHVGLAMLETIGHTGFERTAASLVSLILYLVPLAAMLTTVPAFSSGQGLYRQLLGEPLARIRLVAGKVLGLGLGNSAAICVGFGICIVVVALRTGMAGLPVMLVLLGLMIVTAFAYSSIAALLTLFAGRGIRAYIAVLAVLFASTVLFDLAILGLGLSLPTGQANRLAYAGLFINPADSIRTIAMLVIGGKESLGVAGVLLVRSLGGQLQAVVLLLASLAGWILLPIAGSALLLRHQDC